MVVSGSLPLWRRSPSHGARGAAACGAALALVVPDWLCRRARGGITLGRRSYAEAALIPARCVVLSGSRLCVWSLARSVPLWGRSPSRGAHGAAMFGAALALLASTQPCRRVPGGVAFSRRSSTAATRSLGAFSAEEQGRRQKNPPVSLLPIPMTSRSGAPIPGTKPTTTRVYGAPGAGLVVPPRSRRYDARPPLFRGGGSLPQRGASYSAARALCVWSLARSLPLWGRLPSRGAHCAAACGAALALLAPAWSCRRTHGGVTLGRRSSLFSGGGSFFRRA